MEKVFYSFLYYITWKINAFYLHNQLILNQKAIWNWQNILYGRKII